MNKIMLAVFVLTCMNVVAFCDNFDINREISTIKVTSNANFSTAIVLNFSGDVQANFHDDVYLNSTGTSANTSDMLLPKKSILQLPYMDKGATINILNVNATANCVFKITRLVR